MTPDERRVMETEAREFDLIKKHLKLEREKRGAIQEARALGEALLNNPVQAAYVRYRIAVNRVSKLLDVTFSEAVKEIRALNE